MDKNKIDKANEIYSKMEGAFLANEKNEEYGHYDLCKKASSFLDQCRKELSALELTEEEDKEVGYDHVDYKVAFYWEDMLRR